MHFTITDFSALDSQQNKPRIPEKNNEKFIM